MKEKNVQIFFPVDVSTGKEACELLDEVAEHIDVIKIGLQLMHHIGTPLAIKIASRYGKEIMADCKISDIPATVAGGVAGVAWQGVDYLNLAIGNCQSSAVRAAVKKINDIAYVLEAEGKAVPELIGVTLMTSWGVSDLIEHGIFLPPWWIYSEDEEEQTANIVKMVCREFGGFIPGWGEYKEKRIVPDNSEEHSSFMTYLALKWGKIAVDEGIKTLLSSPREAKAFNMMFPECDFMSPGIRPPWVEKDDQKRTMTPYEAAQAKVKKIVVGRPIREAHKYGMTPAEAAKAIRIDYMRGLEDIENQQNGREVEKC